MHSSSSKFFIAAIIISVALASGCARQSKRSLSGLSSAELSTLQEDPFAHDDDDEDLDKPTFDADDVVTGVNGEVAGTIAEDSLFPTNEPASSSCCVNDEPPKFIRHCDPSMYEPELKEAMERAAADPEKKTIVVRYAISLGLPMDETAFLAYHRTILRSNDDGVTPVPVGPATSLNEHNNAASLHYFADHVKARGQYITGERCYFNTMKIITSEAGPVLRTNGGVEHSLPGTPAASKHYDHTLNVLYYGDAYPCTTEADCYRRYLSPRLFKTNDKVTTDIQTLLADFKVNNLQNLKLSEWIRQCPGDRQPQIVPLYVADFREQRFGLAETDGKLIARQFADNATRRYEYEVKLKKIFDLRTLFWNREKVAQTWWEPKTVSGFGFSPYVGVAQLIDNIIFGGTNGTVLSSQYTPIVLDLGDRHIRTSSVDWGTFFNLANLMWRKPA
ncbi:MAG TPA: hypothetical protein VM598_12985, partial [Bdellovibrionota bacterium]|nr:hypothetical protein [Bdellovibrionota bacterium]